MLKQGLGLISKAATGLRKENTFDPVPYRLNRLVAWMPIKDIPVATGGKTMVEPPNKQTLAAIEALFAASNWEGLVNACESKVKQDVFWLDLSRYVSEAMEQLGHQSVCDVIEAETALFVTRFPGIEKLCFSDGTPFADAATLEWLKQYREKMSGSEAGTGSGGQGGLGQIVGEQVRAATVLVKEKKFDDALAMLMEHLATSTSRREKFLWKIAVCRMLLNAKKTVVASSFIDDLLTDIDTYKLDTWEPENAIEALSLILTGLRLQKNPEHEPLIKKVIKRISMLDPITALKIV
jgi:type VI secretion system protein VasJ